MGVGKLLLPFGDTTVAGSVIRALCDGGVERVIVVGRDSSSDLRQQCLELNVEFAINPEPQLGMLRSIQSGIEAALDDLGAFNPAYLLVTPADVPRLQPQTVAKLLQLATEMDESLWVPTYQGKRGHPLCIPRALVQEIRGLDLTVGLKQLLVRYPQRVREVEVVDPGVLLDIDTPADYAAARGDAQHTD